MPMSISTPPVTLASPPPSPLHAITMETLSVSGAVSAEKPQCTLCPSLSLDQWRRGGGSYECLSRPSQPRLGPPSSPDGKSFFLTDTTTDTCTWFFFPFILTYFLAIFLQFVFIQMERVVVAVDYSTARTNEQSATAKAGGFWSWKDRPVRVFYHCHRDNGVQPSFSFNRRSRAKERTFSEIQPSSDLTF